MLPADTMADGPAPAPTTRAPFHALAARLVLWLAVAFVVVFVAWIVGDRVLYPFELEWMEGAMADHVARVLEGEAIYAPPTYEHVAFLYHPGYFYAAALCGLVTGPGFLPLRLVSILATAGSCALLFRIVRRDGSATGGLVAVGVFVSAFSLAGCYYDVGRIDPLFACLMLGGIDQTRAAKTWRGLAGAAAWFLAAWLTKQTAAVMVPLVVLGCVPGGLKPAAWFGLALGALCGGVELLLDALHDGWLWYFTIEVPRNHGYRPEYAWWYVSHDLLPLLPAFGLLAIYVARNGARRVVLFHGAWILAMLVGSGSSRVHVGGAENVLIPAIAAMAAAAGLGVSRCRHGWARTGAEALAALQIVILFAVPMWGYPFPYAPVAAQRQAAQVLLDEVRAHPGPVFAPWHGYLARLAGKAPAAHAMAMDDVWRSGNVAVIGQMEAALRQRLAAAPAPVVYVDDPSHPMIMGLLRAASYREGRVLGADRAVRLPVGSPVTPQLVMVKP